MTWLTYHDGSETYDDDPRWRIVPAAHAGDPTYGYVAQFFGRTITRTLSRMGARQFVEHQEQIEESR